MRAVETFVRLVFPLPDGVSGLSDLGHGAARPGAHLPENPRPDRQNDRAVHHPRRLWARRAPETPATLSPGARILTPFVLRRDQERDTLEPVKGWLGSVEPRL
ncbi:hypothetical protein GCM10008024_41400 [Allgaiera indica]|uniref:Uncharacterized protein n=2 Tax=Allgaiera indica TaxID=765699 RepID=A0AAN5A364_9RHOB|nr:hypothetical protein GCM10008024_41400 [Allgaiera indica]